MSDDTVFERHPIGVTVGITTTILLLLGVVTLVAFFAKWFFFAPLAVNQQAHIFQGGYGAQSAYIEEADNLVSQVTAMDTQIADPSTPASELPSLRAQRVQITTQACDDIAKITITVPTNLLTFNAQNCQ